MKEHSISEIAKHMGIPGFKARELIGRVKFLAKYPDRIDNDKSLVSAYMRTYRKYGKAAAQKEVYRLIQLAKGMRRLREFFDD